MKKFLLLFFLTVAGLTSMQAQRIVIIGGNVVSSSSSKDTTDNKRKIRLYGSVYDSFTKAALKAHITLMHRDSTVVDTTTCEMWTWGTSDSYYEFRVPRQQDRFIIKAECDGYHTRYIDYDMKYIARNREFEMPRLLLKKKVEEDDIFAEGTLEGVVVTGTKVKIAYRGDTVVYNAAAFNLPEGSMLDGLVREMPGAELKDNGDIYINGKKVDYLTLNGKDFFKGNNKVMLDNLPYYTVQNVEVYDKSSKESEWRGEEVEKKDYVMDVKLKREYNRGLLVNTEGGLGTDDRYLARIFALYYTDHTRLSTFANTNNVNEDRKPGYDGDWTPANQPQGLRSTKQVGLNLTTEDQDKKVEESLDATLTWSDADDQTRTTSERFSADGNNIFSGSESWSRQKDFRFSANNDMRVNAPVKLYMYTNFNYSKGDRNSESNDSTWRDHSLSSYLSPLTSDLSALTNRTHTEGLNKYRSLNFGNTLGWFQKLPWGDNVSLTFTTSYKLDKPADTYSRSLTEYMQTGESDFRDRYTDAHSDSYSYSLEAGYSISLLNGWRISPNFRYGQTYSSFHNMSYLSSVLDTDNSDTHTHFERVYHSSIDFTRSLGNDEGWVSLSLPIDKVNERMHYNDGVLDTIAHRSNIKFQPSFSWYRFGKNFKMVNYNMSVQTPDFTTLMPTDDTTNPLVHIINNPGLKNRIEHYLWTQFSHRNDSTAQRISGSATISLTQNSWGTHSSYNPQTGAYTYMQDNINGNWSAGAGMGYERPLGKARLFTIENNINFSYTHSVDFDLATASSEVVGGAKSKVNTIYTSEEVRLKYQKDKLTLQVGGNVRWRNSKGTSDNFQAINAWEYSYGMTAKYTIPLLNLDLATDLKMFSRRGYNSEMMNTDDLVWNASLSRSFFKGRITARLMAFDILQQLSSTQYSVNAQGRTETWHNCIPRYALLTLAYKFQKMPKNKKK